MSTPGLASLECSRGMIAMKNIQIQKKNVNLQMEQAPCEHARPGRPPPAASAAQDRAHHSSPGGCGLPCYLQVVVCSSSSSSRSSD